MAIKQLFYTSCKKGLSSGMGFQTYSMSKGITDKERREIESHCVYISPDKLPTQPSAEEIDKLFPTAFSYFRLENGKYCICSAKYTGKDYSGRYGNYFCHVLVSEEPYNFYPIELYGSTIFRDCLTDEEKNTSEIECLPDIEEVTLGNIIDFKSISDFLKHNGVDKRKKFTQIMECAVGYSEHKKRIIFSDYKDAVPFWIASVQLSLPKKLALQFSFTTYCYNPDDVNYVFSAVDERGSKFNFKDNQNMYKYSVFDFTKQCSEEIICKSSFIKRAEVGYTVSKEVFLPFLSFLDEFEYNQLNIDIDNCITLYNIVKKGLEKCSIEDVKRALSFAAKYKSKDAYIKLFSQINLKLDKISTQVDVELLEMITKFLIRVSRDIGDTKYVLKAYEFFFKALDYIGAYNEYIPLKYILELHKKITYIERHNIKEFVETSLSEARIKEIQKHIKENIVRSSEYYLITIISSIIAFNNETNNEDKKILFSTKSKEDKNITLLLNDCLKILITSKEDTLYVLQYFKDNYEFIAKMIMRIYYVNYYSYKNSDIEDLMAEFIVDTGNKDSTWKRKIYSQINGLSNSGDFLFSVYAFELKENIDNSDFFIDYCDEIFYFFREYANEKFSDALKLYMDYYVAENMPLQKYKEIINYIDRNLIMNIVDKQVLEKLITDLEEKINIDNSDKEQEIIERVLKLKREYNLKTPCSITELLYIGKRVQNPELPFEEELLEKIEFNSSNNMSKEKYEEYIKWFLSNICVQLRGAEDHLKVKKILFSREYSDVFYNVYIDIIHDIVFTRKYRSALGSYYSESYKILLDFFISLFRNKENLSEEKENIIYNKIIDLLMNISEKNLKEYTKYIVGKTSRLKNVVYIRKKWMEITKIVEEKKEKKRLFNFFKK